jgi:phosphoribosylformimino-5-aminoimidazole carboxamide ribotide isomerase
MYIIPAIDIIDGKCVRLTQGDYTQKTVYSESPVEVAKSFEAAGITRLHVVDLDGAKASHIVNHETLKQIVTQTNLQIDFGGGIKSDEDIRMAFKSGAQQITAGSIAVKSKQTVLRWLQQYGTDKIILGADVKNERIAISGWQDDSGIDLFTFLEEYVAHGISYVICTDIAKDGLLQGASIDLYRKILLRYPQLKLIASGGVTSIDELHELRNAGLYGAIVGKAFYEGKISLDELSKF